MVSRRNNQSDNSMVNRRSLLIGGLGVAAFGINSTAFTTGNASRGLTYEIGADNSNSSVLTLINADSVERKQTNQLAITLTNNTQYTASVTAQLQTQAVIDTVSFTNSTTQNRSTISFTLAGGNTREIFVDVNNNNTADLLQYQLTVDLNEFTTTLTREDTQIVNNTNQIDPNPEPGQIDVVVTQKGNSSNYSADWSVGGDTTNFDRIDVFVNGTQVDTLTTFSGSTKISKDYGVGAGDTITYELIDTNNQLVDSDSQTL